MNPPSPLSVLLTVVLLLAILLLGVVHVQMNRTIDALRTDLRAARLAHAAAQREAPDPVDLRAAERARDEAEQQVRTLAGTVDRLQRQLTEAGAGAAREGAALRQRIEDLQAQLDAVAQRDAGRDQDSSRLIEEARAVRAVVCGNPSEAIDPAVIRAQDLAPAGRLIDEARSAIGGYPDAQRLLLATEDRGLQQYRESGHLRQALADLAVVCRAYLAAVRSAEASLQQARDACATAEGRASQAEARVAAVEERAVAAEARVEAAEARAAEAERRQAEVPPPPAVDPEEAARVATLESSLSAETARSTALVARVQELEAALEVSERERRAALDRIAALEAPPGDAPRSQ